MNRNPYDGKILLVNWKGATTPGRTVAEVVQLIKDKMPNVSGVMLKTSNGISWQGHLSSGDGSEQSITSTAKIKGWVDAFAEQGLEIHVWGVPRGKRAEDIEREAKLLARAANVSGVKSLLLDVEHYAGYWEGTDTQATQLMTSLRAQLKDPEMHLGMIIDGRKYIDYEAFEAPWLSHFDSFHPMVYPIFFGQPTNGGIDQALDVAFEKFVPTGKPVIPMLQAFTEFNGRPTPEQIAYQGQAALNQGASGISFFRLGSDIYSRDGQPHMGDPEYAGIAAIRLDRDGFTWQDVINASITVAGGDMNLWSQWWRQTGMNNFFNNSLRPEPYNGPHVDTLGIPEDKRDELMALLRRSSEEIIDAVNEAMDRLRSINVIEHVRGRQPVERTFNTSIVGIHGGPGVGVPPRDKWDYWLTTLKEMGVVWYKQLDNGDPNDLGDSSIFAWSKELKSSGIEPIIRYYVGEQFPGTLEDHIFRKMQRYAEVGITWAEIGNEPNLDYEWKPAYRARFSFNNHDMIKKLADGWVSDAKRCIEVGAKPGFYAFAPTDWNDNFNGKYSSVRFTRRLVQYLAEHYKDDVVNIFNNGGWIAVHAATYETQLEFSPWRPDGKAEWDMTLRSYEIVTDAFEKSFGRALNLNAIPIISTEGGVFTPESTSMNGRSMEQRLPNDEAHAAQVEAMYRYLEAHSPLDGMCPWCLSFGNSIGVSGDHKFIEDGWIVEEHGTLRERPAIETLKRMERERNQGTAL